MSSLNILATIEVPDADIGLLSFAAIEMHLLRTQEIATEYGFPWQRFFPTHDVAATIIVGKQQPLTIFERGIIIPAWDTILYVPYIDKLREERLLDEDDHLQTRHLFLPYSSLQ